MVGQKENNSPTMKIHKSFTFKDETEDFGFPVNVFSEGSLRSQYLIETDEVAELIEENDSDLRIVNC